MNPNEINLSSISNKSNIKIRDRDEYIISISNISLEELQQIDDEKYNKIIEVIEETLKTKKEHKVSSNTKGEEINNKKNVKPLINTDALITSNTVDKTKEEVEETEIKLEEKIEIKGEDWELFSNYKSEFKTEESDFFKELREKRKKIKARLRMPKTRTSIIIWIPLLAIIAVASLFIIDPDNNSYSIYKANILNIKNKYINKKVESTITKETIEIDSYFFRITKEITNKKTIYKYKWKVFTSRTDLNIYLNKEVKIKNDKLKTLTGSALKEYKQEIIREALKQKYEN